MFTDSEIDRMRYELDHPEVMKKRIKEENQVHVFIKSTKKMFVDQGRDFDKEFQEYLKNKS